MDELNEKQKVRLSNFRILVETGPSGNAMNNLVLRKGDPIACTRSLASFAKLSAVHAWFEHRDLKAMRSWWHVCARLKRRWHHLHGPRKHNAPTYHWDLLAPLMSNDEELLTWFVNYEGNFDSKRMQSHKCLDFWAYQSIVALKGDQPLLLERCERVINDPPKGSAVQKFMIDHHFYHALAKGDMQAMESVLRSIVSPKEILRRIESESGYTIGFISTPACMFAKIARRHGYRVEIDSPYVPGEWLDLKPLDKYENYFDFLDRIEWLRNAWELPVATGGDTPV